MPPGVFALTLVGMFLAWVLLTWGALAGSSVGAPRRSRSATCSSTPTSASRRCRPRVGTVDPAPRPPGPAARLLRAGGRAGGRRADDALEQARPLGRASWPASCASGLRGAVPRPAVAARRPGRRRPGQLHALDRRRLGARPCTCCCCRSSTSPSLAVIDFALDVSTSLAEPAAGLRRRWRGPRAGPRPGRGEALVRGRRQAGLLALDGRRPAPGAIRTTLCVGAARGAPRLASSPGSALRGHPGGQGGPHRGRARSSWPRRSPSRSRRLRRGAGVGQHLREHPARRLPPATSRPSG